MSMSNWLAEFEFLRPWWLLLIPLGIFIVLLLAKRRSLGGWHKTLTAEKLAVLTPTSVTHSLQTNTSSKKTKHGSPASAISGKPNRPAVITWLAIAGIVIALLALAGPTWQATQNPLASQRQAMVILFDLSPSMLAQDLKPDRVTRARLKVIDLLRSRTEGETALVVYAGDAHRIAPLSDDPATVEALVHTLHPDIMPIAGSQVESAITLALDLFSGADLEQGDILLVTDGLHPNAINFIIDTVPANFRLSVLGVGSEDGAAIPVKPAGYLVDDSGNTIIAQLDEASLQNLTQQFSGHYVRLSDDAADIESLVNLASKPHVYQLFGNTLTTSSVEYDSKHDAGYWLVLLLLPLAALAFRRQVLWVLLCACITSMMVPMAFWPSHAQAQEWTTNWQWLWLNDNQQGLKALREGDAETAAQLFSDPDWQAIALYEKGDYKSAAQLMHETIQADENNPGKSKRYITHHDFYNLGNALALSGQYKAATQAYEYALGLNPENANARHNLGIVSTLVPQEEDDAEENANQGGGKADDSNQQTASEDENANIQEASASGTYQQSGAALGSGESLDQSAISGDSVATDQRLDQNTPDPSQTANLDNTEDNQALSEDPSSEASDKDKNSPQDDLIGNRSDGSVLNPYSEQWLNNLVDDPGGYLRRKLQYQAQSRLEQNNGEPPKLDADRY